MKLNTVIKLSDGRIGTICYNDLDGCGGVWGKHIFETSAEVSNPALPQPDFMLREIFVEKLLRNYGHKQDLVCVGMDFEIMESFIGPPALLAAEKRGELRGMERAAKICENYFPGNPTESSVAANLCAERVRSEMEKLK